MEERKGFYRAALLLGEMSQKSTGFSLCRSLPSLPFLVRIPLNKKRIPFQISVLFMEERKGFEPSNGY